jgi:predicted XRE-type DNA-binding protein
MTIEHEESSGNVFADLGFPHSERELVKAKLTVQIYRLLKDRGLTQAEAAKLLGTTQPQISALMRCRPASVSEGRWIEFLTTLGQDVEVTVKPSTRRSNGQQGQVTVTVEPA